MKTLSAAFALVVASLAQPAIKPVPAAGIPGPRADGVKLEAALACLRDSPAELTAELSAKLTGPPDGRFPQKIPHARFFDEKRSLQDC